ncbi:acyltransferase family protein [Bifidobacterium jacchi]|uniref:Acyltransferase 3 domain-containing protein n=1 Tax=Bifidobacterium jacchi TaxID=2490545 RepID=A0A5N5REV9_9BIFI|nr:hypothetical protein EHS19_09605 [Bifidobacterium jacchi]
MQSQRNSSIETLRILSMLMIISHHFIVLSQVKTLELPISVNKLFSDLLLRPGGKIGVTVFFLISAYFLCQETVNTKRNIKRIVALDAQMLFYSLSITFIFLILDYKLVSTTTIVQSFIPLISRMWWYPTSYIIFLLLSPFITVSLRRIGKKNHFNLVLIVSFLWGLIAGLLPKIYLDLSSQNMIIFCYLYILTSFYVWYLKPVSRRFSLTLIGLGLFLIWSNILVCSYLYQKTGSSLFLHLEDSFISHEWKLPVAFTAFGLFSLFVSFQYYSKSINVIAKCTFGVFLIHNHPVSSSFLSHTLFNMSNTFNRISYPLIAISIILLVFILCILIDLIRQQIFKITLDRHINYITAVIFNTLFVLKHRIQQLMYTHEL